MKRGFSRNQPQCAAQALDGGIQAVVESTKVSAGHSLARTLPGDHFPGLSRRSAKSWKRLVLEL